MVERQLTAPSRRRTHRPGGQICGAARRLSERCGGPDTTAVSTTTPRCTSNGLTRRGRHTRRTSEELLADVRRRAGARRLWRPGHGRQNCRRAVRPGKRSVPFLGICLGMQMAVIEFARHVLGLPDANTSEFDPQYRPPRHRPDAGPEHWNQPGRHHAPGQISTAALPPGTFSDKAYGVSEISGAPPPPLRVQQRIPGALCGRRACAWQARIPTRNLVEIVEIPDHPWFVAVQFHPELKSRPNRPHPLFRDFVGAALEHGKNK